MLINIADFVVHVDESLTREQLDRLEDAIRVNACVVSAASHDSTPHLMLVAYDPECTGSKSIVDVVKNQGLHAARVG